ncbi:MAG TPA: hypothetical protein VGK81_03905 [Anaerolineae bacterium]
MTEKSSWFAKIIRVLKRWLGKTGREQGHTQRDDHGQGDRGVFAI